MCVSAFVNITYIQPSPDKRGGLASDAAGCKTLGESNDMTIVNLSWTPFEDLCFIEDIRVIIKINHSKNLLDNRYKNGSKTYRHFRFNN